MSTTRRNRRDSRKMLRAMEELAVMILSIIVAIQIHGETRAWINIGLKNQGVNQALIRKNLESLTNRTSLKTSGKPQLNELAATTRLGSRQ